MPRSVNKVAAHRKRRRILKRARGYWGARSKLWTIAKHHIEKGLQYAYRDRRTKNATSADSGLCASMPPHGSTVQPTHALWRHFTKSTLMSTAKCLLILP